MTNMITYVVSYSDGAHENGSDSFDNIKDAIECYREMKSEDTEGYEFDVSVYWDYEGYCDYIETFNPDTDEDIEGVEETIQDFINSMD